MVSSLIKDRLFRNDPSAVGLYRQHEGRLDPQDRATVGTAVETFSNREEAGNWVRDRSASLPAPQGREPSSEPPAATSASPLLDEDGVAGYRQRLDEIEARRRALIELNEQEFAAQPARLRANRMAIETYRAQGRAALSAEVNGVYAELRRHLTTGGPDGGPAVTLPPATIMSRLTDAQQDAVTTQVNAAIEGRKPSTAPQTWYAIHQGLMSDATDERQRWASKNLVAFMGRLSDEDFATLEKLQAAVRTNDGGAEQNRLQAITRMANQALRSVGIDPTTQPDARPGGHAAQAASFHRALHEELSAFETSKDRKATAAEAYGIVNALKETAIRSGWLEASDHGPTVASDIPLVDDAFHQPGAELAQAEPSPDTGSRGMEMRLDFARLRRMREEEEQREAAARSAALPGGANGAPATEPYPGSTEYRSADEEARRIVAQAEGRVSEAQQPEPLRPSTPHSASIAVPVGPILAPGGAVVTKLAEAVSQVARRAASWLSRAAPAAAGASAGVAAEAVGGAIALIVIPTNTQAEFHPFGKNLRVRTAPAQRTATVQLRVDSGLFGTGVGARWIDLPVGAAWENDDRTGRRYIGVDRLGLETVIGRDAATAALGVNGIAMAKPTSNDGSGERKEPGPGHNSESFGEKLTPEPRDDDPKPPLNPAPLVLPGNETPWSIEREDIRVPLASETGEGFASFDLFKKSQKNAGPGYDWHHIVSQHEENIARFGAKNIHNTNNLVRIPKQIHWIINAEYASKPFWLKGATVREWLLKQSFDEQAAFGREAIKRAIEQAKLESK